MLRHKITRKIISQFEMEGKKTSVKIPKGVIFYH